MGNFDAFLADDDDDVADPVAKDVFSALATGYHGLVDVLSYCQGKCSPQQLKDLKVLYMKRKERQCTVVEFLREARDALGTDLLLQAMVSNRTNGEKASMSRAHTHGQQQSLGSNKAERLALDERNASVSNKIKKVADGDRKGAVNIDVSQEAEDVLAIAGVNPDDEAKLLFVKQTERRRSDAGLSGFQSKDKDPWRKIIELRLFARIDGEGGLASSNRITDVNEQVYDFLEEALQVRLKGFVANVSNCAARRNDANKDAFKKSHSALEPKQKIRRINVNLEREKAERLEKERRALLRVGQSIMSKRKRDFEENTFLKEKVAKVQQEEEERIRATVANQAARDALGDAKYLKWYDMAKTNVTLTMGSRMPNSVSGTSDDRPPDAKPREPETNKGLPPPNKGNNAFDKLRASNAAAASGTKSILLRDCLEALHHDEHGSRLFSIHSFSSRRR